MIMIIAIAIQVSTASTASVHVPDRRRPLPHVDTIGVPPVLESGQGRGQGRGQGQGRGLVLDRDQVRLAVHLLPVAECMTPPLHPRLHPLELEEATEVSGVRAVLRVRPQLE